ncbi:hypothetical protein TELCIR_19850 [Teladorsagia circumcincta]|uniref:Uncharacterized protein n=1 Tax=Teladorsagia circumcincta TaxID=45464 RepID=A0A2G9TMY5_TELCI|nr:hypothetical protein TELCIR_19850 [Teladorsagia circumcincta]
MTVFNRLAIGSAMINPSSLKLPGLAQLAELTLSSRYQISENIATSAMLCVISTVQLTTFAIYAFSMSYLRMTMKHDPMYDPLKETFYMNASGPEGWLNYATQLQKQWQ